MDRYLSRLKNSLYLDLMSLSSPILPYLPLRPGGRFPMCERSPVCVRRENKSVECI